MFTGLVRRSCVQPVHLLTVRAQAASDAHERICTHAVCSKYLQRGHRITMLVRFVSSKLILVLERKAALVARQGCA